MSNQKIKIIKKQTVAKLEENLYKEQVSVARNIFRWLKIKRPEKAKELLRELQTEVVI